MRIGHELYSTSAISRIRKAIKEYKIVVEDTNPITIREDYPRKRVADFQQRVHFTPDSVLRHRQRNWEYIPIHPFADVSAGDIVDAWWSVNDDATLLQAFNDTSRKHGLYARQTDDELRWTYLAIINCFPSRHLFENVMCRFVAMGFPNHERFNLKSEDGWVCID